MLQTQKRKGTIQNRTNQPVNWVFGLVETKVLNKHVKKSNFLAYKVKSCWEDNWRTVPDALSSGSFLQTKKHVCVLLTFSLWEFYTVFRPKIWRKLRFLWMKGYKDLQKWLFDQESWKAQVKVVIRRPELLSYS